MHNHPILRLPVYWHASDVGQPARHYSGQSWVEASEIQETLGQLHRQNWAVRRWLKNSDCLPSCKRSCSRRTCNKWKTQTRRELHTVPHWEIGASSVGGTRWGTRWRSWFRHCATSRKVAGSIPDGVIGIFHWHNPSGRTLVLGSTQPLIEIRTRNISWGWGSKNGRCIGPTTLPPLHVDCLEIWEPQAPGILRACPGLYRDCHTFTCTAASMC